MKTKNKINPQQKNKNIDLEKEKENYEKSVALAIKIGMGKNSLDRLKKNYEEIQKEARAPTEHTQTQPLERCQYFKKEEEHMIYQYIPDDFISNARHLMKLPVYSLETKKIKEKEIEYNFVEKGIKYHLKVYTTEKFGIADQRDGDIVRHALSHIIYNHQIYGKLTDTVCLSQYELLKKIKKDTHKQGYEWLENAMSRLSSTYYDTNLWVENPLDTFRGTLLSVVLKHDKELEKRYVKITFNREALPFLIGGGILNIDRKILEESSNLRKKLLEVIQSYMGKKDTWQIGVKKLIKTCGYKKSQKLFNQNLKRLDLPYEINKKTNQQKEQIICFSKNKNLNKIHKQLI